MNQRLQWREAAPGLLYEASGDSGRRFTIAAAGDGWTLELRTDREYASELSVDPQPAVTLDEAKETAQRWEAESW